MKNPEKSLSKLKLQQREHHNGNERLSDHIQTDSLPRRTGEVSAEIESKFHSRDRREGIPAEPTRRGRALIEVKGSRSIFPKSARTVAVFIAVQENPEQSTAV